MAVAFHLFRSAQGHNYFGVVFIFVRYPARNAFGAGLKAASALRWERGCGKAQPQVIAHGHQTEFEFITFADATTISHRRGWHSLISRC